MSRENCGNQYSHGGKLEEVLVNDLHAPERIPLVQTPVIDPPDGLAEERVDASVGDSG